MKKLITASLLASAALAGCRAEQPSPNHKETVDTPKPGIEINGVHWAGANAGMFFQFNRPTNWTFDGGPVSIPSGTAWQSSVAEGTEWLSANGPCPDGWRIPTMDEFRALTDAAEVLFEWTSEGSEKGQRFTDKDNPDNTIFLSAMGYMTPAGAVAGYGTMGFYHADRYDASEPDDIQVGALIFAGADAWAGTSSIKNAYPIRCVAE